MKSSLPIIFSLSLTFSLLIAVASSATAPPPLHQSHFYNHRLRLRNSTGQPKEYLEVTRPLPFDPLVPSCALPIFAGVFGNTIGLPPSSTSYSPPVNCTWSNVVLHLSASSIGDQYDRIAAVWLSGAEILRTSTPEPTSEGIFWSVRKDVSRYSSLLRQSNLTLSVMLENVVNDIFTGVYHLNLTFLYYDINCNPTGAVDGINFPLSMIPPEKKSNPEMSELIFTEESFDLNKNPADLIIPISAVGDTGFWFRIENESDVKHKGVKIPSNTYRAVIEVYVSFHGNDEFWYSNPPDAYIAMNGLPTRRGHGSYREVEVTIDDNVVGSTIPFPVIFTGGINPLFWDPVVSIGAFDLPSYEMELTPFLGILLNGKKHYFGLRVTGAISFWLVNANLHLWVDHNVDRVQARAVKYENPSSCIEREFKFQELDGKFEVEGERESEFYGWVNSTAGNYTTRVTTKLEFENSIRFKESGAEKSVEQEVKVKKRLRITSQTGILILDTKVESKYPLEITSSTSPGSKKGTYLVTSKLKQSLKEEKSTGSIKSTSVNTQKSEGWMFVLDHAVLSGAASTNQNYAVEDGLGCYSRRVLAADGCVQSDTASVLCASKL